MFIYLIISLCFYNKTKIRFLLMQVYKSASKRKAHILKNHPGAELPPSIRKLRPAAPGEPDPMLSTHTQLTGTIATAPVCCPHCAKQYSSKVSTKLPHRTRSEPSPPLQFRWLYFILPSGFLVLDQDGSTHQKEASKFSARQHHPYPTDHSRDQQRSRGHQC